MGLFHSTLKRRGMISMGLERGHSPPSIDKCGAKPPLFHMSSWCGAIRHKEGIATYPIKPSTSHNFIYHVTQLTFVDNR
jgi:hypothetical protein